MLRFWTAGESHGKAILALIDGFPAGVTIDESQVNAELQRRQGGYGRGGRQRIESDTVEILSGVWHGVTIGSPITLQIANRDCKLEGLDDLESPRPGHGDLVGAVKHLGSIRGVLERASARETAARVAAGAVARQLLRSFGIETIGYVVELGGIPFPPPAGTIAQLRPLRDQSAIYSLVPDRDSEARQRIDEAAKAGDTLGGIMEARVDGLPIGLGSHAQWDRKLDGRLAAAVMSIQAIKAVEIGLGIEAARRKGSEVQDPIHFRESDRQTVTLGYHRPTNHAGGLEAGITNGQPLIVRAAKKPISTLRKPLESIEMQTKQPHLASYERSDVCAVPAASVIVEHVVAWEVACAFVDKYGNDSLAEMHDRWDRSLDLARQR